MKLETICTISVCYLIFQTFWQIDNLNCLVRTPVDAQTTTDTQDFRNERNLRSLCYFNTNLASLVDRACLCTIQITFFRFALVSVDDCNAGFFLLLLVLLFDHFCS